MCHEKSACQTCLAFCSIDSTGHKILGYTSIFWKQFYFVVSELKIIGHKNPDNNLESPCTSLSKQTDLIFLIMLPTAKIIVSACGILPLGHYLKCGGEFVCTGHLKTAMLLGA
jgi:hypothetical protein